MRLDIIALPIIGFSVLTMSSHTGCAKETRLADIPRPSLSLFLPEPPGTVQLRVLPDEKHINLEGPCNLLAPNARATLNGVSLKRLRGKHVGDDLRYDRDCIVEFEVAVDAIPKKGTGASLQISDDSATWTLEIPTAFAPRSIALVSPTDRVIRRGERVVVRWSPSNDRMDWRGIAFELLRPDSRPGTGTMVKNVEVRGEELSFTPLPGDGEAPWRGPALLRFGGTYLVKPAFGACPVPSCSVTLALSVPSLALTIEG
jgi:hypothetical protein